MSLSSRSQLWVFVFVTVSLPCSVFAQKPALDLYRVRVVTNEGARFRGILDDVSNTHLFISAGSATHLMDQSIPLASIRKVALRRVNKRSAWVTGAILGSLLTGYLSVQSLQKNQPSSSISYGLTLTFAAAGGAAGGLLVGAAVGNFTKRVIRPSSTTEPEISLVRQLQPFSIRYQQQFINRLPQPN